EHQTTIRLLKSQGFVLVEYARRSPGKETTANRLGLLQHMAGRLEERCLVDKVSVSPVCRPNQPVSLRD
ncbi:hypothetical protein BCR43DRAFT_403839, partial [Syncephalastrum racemosum]